MLAIIPQHTQNTHNASETNPRDPTQSRTRADAAGKTKKRQERETARQPAQFVSEKIQPDLKPIRLGIARDWLLLRPLRVPSPSPLSPQRPKLKSRVPPPTLQQRKSARFAPKSSFQYVCHGNGAPPWMTSPAPSPSDRANASGLMEVPHRSTMLSPGHRL